MSLSLCLKSTHANLISTTLICIKSLISVFFCPESHFDLIIIWIKFRVYWLVTEAPENQVFYGSF